MTNPTTLRRTLGERLAKSRKVAGLTQTQMAELTGIGKRSIVRYEDDEAVPSLPRLLKWANVTDVPISWLIDETFTEKDLQGYLGHPALRGGSPQVTPGSQAIAA